MELGTASSRKGEVVDDVLKREKKPQLSAKLPPSHPNFDRSRFSDAEFIELLLFENKGLQSTISNRDNRILKLVDLMKENNVAIPGDLQKPVQVTEEPLVEDEVPQRSARRRRNLRLGDSEVSLSNISENERRESIASITSNGPIAISDGVPLSTNFRSELSAAAAMSRSPERSGSDSMMGTVGSPTKFVNIGTSRPMLAVKTLLDNTNLESGSPHLAPPIRSASSAEQRDDQRTPKLSPEQKTNEASLESVDSSKNRKSSSSSASSYKSRIKLPATLKQYEPRNIGLESLKDSSSDIHRNFSDSTRHSPSSPASTVVSQTVPYVKEGSAQIGDSLTVPRTPDAFKECNGKLAVNNDHFGRPSEQQSTYFGSPFNTSHSNTTPRTTTNFDILKSPLTNLFASSDSIASSHRPSLQSHGSSFHLLHSPKPEDDNVSLFIKPEEFQTIRITVVSTINVNPKKSDELNCTFSINDKETQKEMWRIRKSYDQLVAFDNEIRPIVEFFGLPILPDRSIFSSTAPSKIDSRRNVLQDYFNTLFLMPHIPQMVLYRICRYLSLDFVNPLDDFKSGAKKEGYLIRRYKGLGTTWKIRWCQVDGPALEIYEFPGGPIIEQIKLSGSQIGRQSTDTVAEDRGYRHAFLILESTKTSKLSSSLPKHFFCAESDQERDEWISSMVQFTENDPLEPRERISTSTDQSESRLARMEYQNDHHDAGSRNGYNCDETEVGSNRTLGASSNYSHNPAGLEYNSEQYADEAAQKEAKEAKEAKKLKKRSLFPFRYKTSNNGGEGQTPAPFPPPDKPSQYSTVLPDNTVDSSMQTYLGQMKLSDNFAKAIFGRELEDAFELSNHKVKGRPVPSICYRCLDFLNKTGAVYEEGIFRLSGSASTMRQLKDSFNVSFDLDLFESPLKPDMHTVAGLFKTYLRELPSPIFGRATYHDLQSILTARGSSVSRSSSSIIIRDFLNNSENIDKIHYDICYTIFGFLKTVIANSSSNRMNLKNVCIVFVPTLNISLDILSLCLIDFDCIFGNSKSVADEQGEVLDLQIPNF